LNKNVQAYFLICLYRLSIELITGIYTPFGRWQIAGSGWMNYDLRQKVHEELKSTLCLQPACKNIWHITKWKGNKLDISQERTERLSYDLVKKIWENFQYKII
jgi:hypothetical protein